MLVAGLWVTFLAETSKDLEIILITGCGTNIYKYSFFPRSVKEWNKLPETIIEAANTEAFKLALRAQARPH